MWLKFLLLGLSFSMACANASTYRKIILEELVDKAVLIAVLEQVPSTAKVDTRYKKQSANFRILNMIVNDANANPTLPVRLCTAYPHADSYDFRLLDEPLIVFAARNGSCYRPLLGRSGIVGIHDQTVMTYNIADQEESQNIDVFVEKILQTRKDVRRKKGRKTGGSP
jgi:hypothetical protein